MYHMFTELTATYIHKGQRGIYISTQIVIIM